MLGRMTSFIAAFALSTAVAALLTPLVRWLALRAGAVDEPGRRHVHRSSTPRLGGVAVFLAFAAPLFAFYVVDSNVAGSVRSQPGLVLGLVAGAFLMCLLGFVDDVKGVRALYKLLAQIAVAAFAYFCGFRIDSISLPFLGTAHMGAFALPVTVLWIVTIVNAVNLIDGLDGLAGGVVFFAALTNFALAYLGGSVFMAAVMACVVGAVLGFLFFNFNPARIFMGDSGSYFLGFVLAAASVSTGTSQKTSTAVALLVPIIALGLPIFDTLFAIVRRFLERRPLFAPDKSHIHHLLVDMGLTQRRAVLILYGVSVLLAVAAIGVSLGRDWEVGVALLLATVVIFGLVRFVGAFQKLHLLRKQKEHVRSHHVELLRRRVPGLLPSFAAVSTREELLAALENAARELELTAVELLLVSGREEERLHLWKRPNGNGRREGAKVSARFPIANGGGEDGLVIKFSWHSELNEVSPQADILFQMLVDAVRLRS